MFRISDILTGFDYEFDLTNKPNIYIESLANIKSFSYKIINRKLDKNEAEAFFKSLMQDFFSQEDIFLNCFFHMQGSKGFISAHILNTMFLSYAVANWIEFKDEDLLKIIIISFFINISFKRLNNILKKERIANDNENKIEEYNTTHSAEFFESIYPREKEIAFFIKNHHNYHCKESHPTNTQLAKLFNIILLSDSFETLTHPRPYCEALKPYAAIKKVIKEFDNIEKDALKEFIDYVGIYPVTSLIRLNAKENGVVVSQNKGFPLRPKVRILDKDSPAKEKVLNLLTEKDIFIEEVL